MIDKIFENVKRVHFIGIGGVSMSALAEILNNKGYIISGSDLNSGALLDNLIKKGFDIKVGHYLEKAKLADLVIYTGAVSKDDEELKLCYDLNKKIIERADFLGMLSKQYNNAIAICGTHGKTTTTSMLSSIFLKAKMDPTIQVGGFFKEIGGNYRIGNGDIFIFEACEYHDSFLKFFPRVEVILNIDEDHTDYFGTLDRIIESFKKFTQNLNHRDDGIIVANADDENVRKVIDYIRESDEFKKGRVKLYTFGIEDKKEDLKYPRDIIAKKIIFGNTTKYMACMSESLKDDILKRTNKKYEDFEIELSIFGKHNIYNSLAATLTSMFYGISEENIDDSLFKFTGADRRMEYKGERNNIKVYDDYSHHPAEIAAFNDSLRSILKKENNPNSSVFVIFEPHTYSRTIAHLDEFAQVLSCHDNVILSKIYAAREKDNHEVSSKDIADRIKKINPKSDVVYIENYEDIVKYLNKKTKSGDFIFTVGAGSITKVGPMFLSSKKNNEKEK